MVMQTQEDQTQTDLKTSNIDEHTRDYHAPVHNAILEGIQKAIRIDEPCYLVIEFPREEGKTYNVNKFITFLQERNLKWDCLYLHSSKNRVDATLEDSNYLEIHGVTKERGWEKRDNVYTFTQTGSVITLGTIATSRDIEKNRGIHPKFIVQDEAQNITGTSASRWTSVFGRMGRHKNSIKILMGTGGYTTDNLLTKIKKSIRAGKVKGVIVSMNVYELAESYPSEYRTKRLKQLEEEYALKQEITNEDGEKEYVVVGSHMDDPEFKREYLLKDISGISTGGLAFPSFKEEENTFDAEYEIDFDETLFISCDFGDDGSVATFTQIKNDVVYTFAEIVKAGLGSTGYREFAKMVAHLMEDLGIIKLEIQDIDRGVGKIVEKYDVEFLHKDIYWLGDQHGRGTNWIKFFEEFFFVAFEEVGVAEEGLDTIRDLIETRQAQISSVYCPKLCQHLISCRSQEYNTKDHLSIEKSKSHTIVTLSYLYQYLFAMQFIKFISDPKIEPEKTKKQKSRFKEKRVIPISSNLFRETGNFTIKSF